ncbi:molybdenum import ATP-binding protein ModC [Betaproteobacteria bacterium]|nr:molybdenum import ATP-binding protein ModC [Betaproteobacteria bacterium]GHU02561.1 molybdenum import ATP-binding protein ModC [Betaproteobacteria bacterium]GHU09384.1 molybdenum import ATP-binding protein ModC [Betaproteobacteria bacterium]GHU20006.1 molybdenum import ATP-binding protein ModC [Betaproteobacteria bacterium]GHU31163.1 molybdenum import ATP-binding protein ModC [Betaproteobacteria bacterium]
MIEANFHLDYSGFSLNVELHLPEKGVTALFGHSGSGKTTLLRCVAGLDRAPKGRLVVAGDIWQDEAQGIFLPTHKRPLGLVFQEASLFPHLSVRKNLEYGMRRSGNKTGEGFDASIALLGIGPLLDRAPDSLSGGERQRVAVARALLTRPRLLLMDEPLAALDLKRKQEILPYLEKLREELDIPVFYVSHAPDEVARLADHLVLLENGQVVASGPLMETLARADLPPAFTDDAGIVLEATVTAHDPDGLTRLEFPGGHLYVSYRDKPLGSRLRCRIHASDVSLALTAHGDSSILNTLPATVQTVVATDTPGHVLAQLALHDGTLLLARITERSRLALGITPGVAVVAQVKSVALLA